MSFAVIQTVTGMIGSVGFAVLFGVRGKRLAVIALGSGVGWAVYLLCRAAGWSIFSGLLAASLFVAALSEILARIIRTPVILLLVPMLIPEVPGEALYYTMYYLVQLHIFSMYKNAELLWQFMNCVTRMHPLKRLPGEAVTVIC